jgi:hypothetical protein
MALWRECETFRLAIQITKPPCIKKRRCAAAHRQIIEPRIVEDLSLSR